MKTLLIPVDFSKNAELAVKAARKIAIKTGAKLIYLHAYQPYVNDVSLPVTMSSLPIYKELESGYREKLEHYVTESRNLGLEADCIWENMDVHSAVFKHVKEVNSDLIVLGRTGNGGFFDKLIGSSATKIALEAPCPVLVVPHYDEEIGFENVVYATQLEYEEMDILRQVVSFTQLFDAQLRFIKVSSLEQPNIQDDQQYIEEIVKELGISPEDIAIHTGGGVVEGIENYCQKVDADLLVVSTRERGFLEKILINPSVTKELVVDTQIPLLVYHIQ